MFDIDATYDECTAAIESHDWIAAIEAAQAMKDWTFTNEAREYDNSALTSLRSYCDLVVTMHGHKAEALASR